MFNAHCRRIDFSAMPPSPGSVLHHAAAPLPSGDLASKCPATAQVTVGDVHRFQFFDFAGRAQVQPFAEVVVGKLYMVSAPPQRQGGGFIAGHHLVGVTVAVLYYRSFASTGAPHGQRYQHFRDTLL